MSLQKFFMKPGLLVNGFRESGTVPLKFGQVCEFNSTPHANSEKMRACTSCVGLLLFPAAVRECFWPERLQSLHKLNQPRGKPTEDFIKGQIIALRRMGMTIRDVAKELKMSKSTVGDICIQHTGNLAAQKWEGMCGFSG